MEIEIKHRPVFGEDFDLGWVGFVHDATVLAQGIAYLSRKDRQSDLIITHNFLVTGPNECVEANLPVGVVASELDHYLNREECVVLFRKPKGLTEEIAARLVERAKSQVGLGFDYGGFAAEA